MDAVLAIIACVLTALGSTPIEARDDDDERWDATKVAT